MRKRRRGRKRGCKYLKDKSIDAQAKEQLLQREAGGEEDRRKGVIGRGPRVQGKRNHRAVIHPAAEVGGGQVASTRLCPLRTRTTSPPLAPHSASQSLSTVNLASSARAVTPFQYLGPIESSSLGGGSL